MTSATRPTFERLIHIETMLWNRCDEAVRRHTGLPLGRLEVLRVISAVEHCRVQDIASRLLITVGAASKLVDRLEASGHCQRHANPDDRRSSRLTVTRAGQDDLAATEEIMEQLLQQAFGTTDLQHLNDALAQVEHALQGSHP